MVNEEEGNKMKKEASIKFYIKNHFDNKHFDSIHHVDFN